MLNSLYENIGGKIKNLAKWSFVVEAIGAIITGFVLIGNDPVLAGVLTLFCGPIVAWVGSWILYAFGELVENVQAIRCKECPIEKASSNPNVTKKGSLNSTSSNTDGVPHMDKPIDFEPYPEWEKGIKKLSYEKLYARYLDEGNYSDIYRYMCYLELIERNEQQKTAE